MKYTLYMDDINVMMRDVMSLEQVLKLMENYREALGAKVNKANCAVMRVANWRGLGELWGESSKE